MKISGIYKIQSIIKPERVYIGSAVSISNRWNQHLHYLRKNKHHSIKLQRHFNKYGESDLQFSILLGCKKEDLIKNEQYFLDSYFTYFNTCKIAGSLLGTKRTEEQNKALSKRMMGNKNCVGIHRDVWNKGLKNVYSDESRKKMSESHKGKVLPKGIKRKPLSEEHRNKISESNKGRIVSEETRIKIGNSHRGRKGQIPWNKGKTGLLSDTTRQSISNSLKGKKQSSETIQKRAEANRKVWELKRQNGTAFGNIPWSKGKTGVYSEDTLNKIRNARHKQVFTQETQDKKSETMKKIWALKKLNLVNLN